MIVLMISSGLAMFTYKSTDFVFVGFFMVLSASFLSGKLTPPSCKIKIQKFCQSSKVIFDYFL